MKQLRLVGALAAAIGLVMAPAGAGPSVPYIPVHTILGSLEVSEAAGLGRVEVNGDLAAVLQRDEGIVALVDVSNPSRPDVLGRYDDDARLSLDGDLAFSTDGRWLLYARQTHQFSLEGVHVIDVSDPSTPTLAHYQPGGGTLRIAHHDDGTDEWVVVMDAVTGMVVYRLEPLTGALAPVHVNALPALKVGGPASAGIVIQDDPIEKKTLLYASTGQTGVEVFDFTDPANPVLLGSWSEIGLAELEVQVTGKKRTIYGASEYWFDKQQEPLIVRLDASKLGAIKKKQTLRLSCTPDDRWRVQGMTLLGGELYAAHSTVGLVAFLGGLYSGKHRFTPYERGGRNDAAGVLQGPYVFDVEAAGGLLYVTDAATGILTIVGRHHLDEGGYSKEDRAFNSRAAARRARCR